MTTRTANAAIRRRSMRSVSEGKAEMQADILSSVNHDHAPFSWAVDAGGELELDIAGLAGTGDERDVGRKILDFRFWILDLLKCVDQVRDDLSALDDGDVDRRQERGDSFLAGPRAHHER